MTRRILIILICMFIFPTTVSAEAESAQRNRTAGVLVYCEYRGETWVLLCHEKNYRYWGIPWGKATDGETQRDAALRELREETREVYGAKDQELVKEDIDVSVDDKTEATLYTMKVDHYCPQELRDALPGVTDKPYNEINSYTWVPWDELASAIEVQRNNDYKDVSIPEKYRQTEHITGIGDPPDRFILLDKAAQTMDEARRRGLLTTAK